MVNRVKWTVGDSPKLRVVFKNPTDDSPVNPITVQLVIKQPNVSAVTHTFGSSSITNPALGTYVYVLPLTTAGTYRWKWVGTNGASEGAAEEGSLDAVTSV